MSVNQGRQNGALIFCPKHYFPCSFFLNVSLMLASFAKKGSDLSRITVFHLFLIYLCADYYK